MLNKFSKVKYLLILPLLFSYFYNYSQGVFIDPRDSNQYELIQIAGFTMFQENLKYTTPHSFYKYDSLPLQGNYYYYFEADSLCPVGWEIPSWKQLEIILDTLVSIHNIPRDSIKVTGHEEKESNDKSKTYVGINLHNPIFQLGLNSSGWVEGNKQKNQEELKKHIQAHYWVKDDFNKNLTTHAHIYDSKLTIHSHKHAILIKKKKKKRRFSVKCIKVND